ncbi:hypothetical protein [Lentzea sp. NPDC092896]|uniref:hypothetical protein n=1 Tax=Lentzea sp. NPDC092896 TaxID=3364127 RepID=UPI0037FD8D37
MKHARVYALAGIAALVIGVAVGITTGALGYGFSVTLAALGVVALIALVTSSVITLRRANRTVNQIFDDELDRRTPPTDTTGETR